jgi:hypothetical protein
MGGHEYTAKKPRKRSCACQHDSAIEASELCVFKEWQWMSSGVISNGVLVGPLYILAMIGAAARRATILAS